MSEYLCKRRWDDPIVFYSRGNVGVCTLLEGHPVPDGLLNTLKEDVFLNLPEILASRQIQMSGRQPQECLGCSFIQNQESFSRYVNSRMGITGNCKQLATSDGLAVSFAPSSLLVFLDSGQPTIKNPHFQNLFWSWLGRVKNSLDMIELKAEEPLVLEELPVVIQKIYDCFADGKRDRTYDKLVLHISTLGDVTEKQFSKFLSTIQNQVDNVALNFIVSSQVHFLGENLCRNVEQFLRHKKKNMRILYAFNLKRLDYHHMIPLLQYIGQLQARYNIMVDCQPRSQVPFGVPLELTQKITDYIDENLGLNSPGYLCSWNNQNSKYSWDRLSAALKQRPRSN